MKGTGDPVTVELSSLDSASTDATAWKVDDLINGDGKRYLDFGVTAP
jgi:hypothetical protein